MSGHCRWPGCTQPATKRRHCRRHYDLLYHCGRLRAALVDPAPAVARLGRLADLGVTHSAVAARTGLARSTVTRIAHGRYDRLRLTTADRIMAIPLPALEEAP